MRTSRRPRGCPLTTACVLLALVVSTLIAVPAPTARAAAPAPAAPGGAFLWTGPDGVGMQWEPGAVTSLAGAATSFEVSRRAPEGTTPWQEVGVVAATGAARYRFAAGPPTEAVQYSVVAVNDTGRSERTLLGTGSLDVSLAADPYDLVYVHEPGRTRMRTPTGAEQLVGGDVDALTFAMPDAGSARLTNLAALRDFSAPVRVDAGGQTSSPQLTMTTRQGDCRPSGTIDTWRPLWTAGGAIAALQTTWTVSCGGSTIHVTVSWRASRSTLPPLPFVPERLMGSFAPGQNGDFVVTVSNLGGGAVRFARPRIDRSDIAFNAAAWSDLGGCADVAVTAQAPCTVRMHYAAPPEDLDSEARVTLAPASGSLGSDWYVAFFLRVAVYPDPLAPRVVPPTVTQLLVPAIPAVPFSVVDPVGGGPVTAAARCRLDTGAWRTCTSPWRPASALPAGPHMLTVQAQDTRGRWSLPVAFALLVDASGPGRPVLDALPIVAFGNSVDVRWTVSGAASAQIAVRSASPWQTLGAWTFPSAFARITRTTTARVPVASTATTCVAVRATDGAGNAGPWSASRCTTAPIDDTKVSASSGWWRQHTSAAWGSTMASTSRARVSLTGPVVRGRTFGVVAVTGRGAGLVDVYVGSVRVGRVNLAAGRSGYRQVRTVTASRELTGRLSVRTVVAAPVRIDALVAAH